MVWSVMHFQSLHCHLSHVLESSRGDGSNKAHSRLLLLLSPTISQETELSIHWLYSRSSTAPGAAQWSFERWRKEDGARYVEAVGNGHHHRGVYQPD